MKKLTLEIETLQVQTFATDAEGGARGTVAARQQADTSPEQYTCWSCPNTCGAYPGFKAGGGLANHTRPHCIPCA